MKRGATFRSHSQWRTITDPWCYRQSHSSEDEVRLIEGPQSVREVSVTRSGERWRDGLATANADQVDFAE